MGVGRRGKGSDFKTKDWERVTCLGPELEEGCRNKNKQTNK